MFSPQSITRVTAIALTAGAVAAPVATARPARMAPRQSVAAISVSQQRQLSAAAQRAASPATALKYGRQDKQVAPSPSSQTPVNAAPTSPPTATASNGFDWGDAGIGAAGALAISIVGVGGTLALSQRRSRRTRPPAIAAS